MRLKFIALTLGIASVAALIYGYHQRDAQATAAVHSAQVAVDTLYRNSAHTMPATDLSDKKIAQAKALMRKTHRTPLSDSQKAKLKKANTELSAAVQMYSVTQATQAPIAPTTSYQQTAESALNAYQHLQSAKPVFTQIYQQPVSNLGQAAKAVDALNQLQSATQVSKDDIKSAQAQVEQVTEGQDTAFAAEAAQVVSDAEQKIDASPSNNPATPYDETTSTSATTSSTSSEASVPQVSATSASTSGTSTESAPSQKPPVKRVACSGAISPRYRQRLKAL
ncbi:hypothetical protein, partial [Lacticaseibacillus porcinae]|uniref:hypothetical protein n=1 Tax=Lacticaseibacillus porcinae TaxID=1123687 RepID=UPI0013DE68FD